jgi:type II secretory pathway pseudopilin PulG
MALVVFFGVLAVFAASAMITGAILQRNNAENELLFVGTEFRNAIKSYYESSPGVPQYPPRLEDLLADPRFPAGAKRHLRQIYPDPLTGRPDWGTVAAPGGGIMGVYSLSPAKAVKMFGFPPEFKNFEGKGRISEWIFSYVPLVLPIAPAPVAAPADTAAAAPAADAPPATTPVAAPAAPLPAPPAAPASPPSPSPEEQAALKKLEELLKQVQ